MYKAIILSEKSKKLVASKYPGIHPKRYGDHVTLEYPLINDVGQDLLVSIKAIGYAQDEKGEALVIELPDNIFYKNDIPHITISTAQSTKRVYSNELLKKGFSKIEPFEIEGIIKILE